MTIAELTKDMIDFYSDVKTDVAHTLKVWGYAKTIGELENLDSETQYITEVTALVHDISIPYCRLKYGKADGDLQEKESAPIVEEFLHERGLDEKLIKRVSYLVSHHHSPSLIDGIDFQILIEADYLVNADESSYSDSAIKNYHDNIFKTAAGKAMLKSIYL